MVPVVVVPRKLMSTAPVSHEAYHKLSLSVPDDSWVLSGKYQFPRSLPLPPSPVRLDGVPQQSGLGGVPQQVMLSVTQYSAFSSSPMTDGSCSRTPWLGKIVPFRARPGPAV